MDLILIVGTIAGVVTFIVTFAVMMIVQRRRRPAATTTTRSSVPKGVLFDAFGGEPCDVLVFYPTEPGEEPMVGTPGHVYGRDDERIFPADVAPYLTCLGRDDVLSMALEGLDRAPRKADQLEALERALAASSLDGCSFQKEPASLAGRGVAREIGRIADGGARSYRDPDRAARARLVDPALRGSYSAADRTLTVVVHGRPVEVVEMIEAQRIVELQLLGRHRPVARVVYVFMEHGAAADHVTDLAHHGLECQALVDGRHVAVTPRAGT